MKKKYRNKCALNFIKAITSRGGDGYEEWEVYNEDYYEGCFSDWLNEQPRISGTLYRGYRVDRNFYREYQIGEVVEQSRIYNYHYPSFTNDRLRAALYINDYEVNTDNVVNLVFEVECVGKYAVDISKYSYYPEENEHKFVSNAKFEIIDVISKGTIKRIKLKEI